MKESDTRSRFSVSNELDFGCLGLMGWNGLCVKCKSAKACWWLCVECKVCAGEACVKREGRGGGGNRGGRLESKGEAGWWMEWDEVEVEVCGVGMVDVVGDGRGWRFDVVRDGAWMGSRCRKGWGHGWGVDVVRDGGMDGESMS